MAIVKNLPTSETGRGVLCHSTDGMDYCISQNKANHKHTLWHIVPGGYEKISVGNNPYELYGLIPGFDKK